MNKKHFKNVSYFLLLIVAVVSLSTPLMAGDGYLPIDRKDTSIDLTVNNKSTPSATGSASSATQMGVFPGATFQLGLWEKDPDGNMALDTDLGDTNIDFVDDLDLKTDEDFTAKVELSPFAGTYIRFGATLINFEGSNTITRSITVNGNTYNVGETVNTDLKLDTYNIGYRQELSAGPVTVSPLFQINIVDFSAQVNNETTGQEASEDTTVAYPVVGAQGRFTIIPKLELYGELKGVSYSASNADGTTYEYEIAAHYFFNDYALMGLGYRKTSFDLDSDETEMDFSFDGPYITAELRF